MSTNGKREALSSVDTAWLRMEDPTNLMMITGLLIFDELVSFERVKATMEHRLVGRFRRFRQRVVTPAFGMPYWEDDPKFDLRSHVRHLALPAPGDQTALQALVSDLMSTPLDFSKSPWQYHLIDGYGSGSVLLGRLHHCIADGIALINVLLSMTDHDADAPWPEPMAAPTRNQRGLVQTLMRQSASAMQTTARMVNVLSDPLQVMQATKLGFDGAAALSKLVLMGPDPKTVFKGPLGVAKQAAWSQPLPLDDVKAVGRVIGATVNDVLLTAVTGALRRYLQHRDAQVDGLDIRAVVPVNLRPLDEVELGNKFGLVFLSLPVGIEDMIERLAELKKRMDAIKGSPEAVVAFGILNAMGRTPDDVQEQIVRLFGVKATAVMTNVPGPRETLYFAGSPVRQIMFWVPQSGRLGLGVSILSYAGSVLLGVATDAGLAPDPEVIIDGFHKEFDYMLNLARLVEH